MEEVAEETINGREETIFCHGGNDIVAIINIFLECQIFPERVATPSHGEQPVVTAPAEG